MKTPLYCPPKTTMTAVLIVACSLPFWSLAQMHLRELNRTANADIRLNKLKNELLLTDAQLSEIKEIQAQTKAKQLNNWQAFRLERRKFMITLKKNRIENQMRIYAVLNPEQQRKFDKMILQEMDNKINRNQENKPDEGGK